jgi:FixJ family two-component response regulator
LTRSPRAGNLSLVPSKAPHPSPPKPPADALVCIVDDDESVRNSLSRLFGSARIAAETFDSGKALLERTMHDGPWCLVLDVQMPGLDGLELQQALAHREAQIVFLSGHGDVPTCAGAMKAGAIDFLTKPVDDQDLLVAVARALARSVEVRKAAAERGAARARLDALTPREFEVMQRVIAGLLNKQIAYELGAAEKTIKIHRGRMMGKMGVFSVANLVRVAQAAGVAPAAANS